MYTSQVIKKSIHFEIIITILIAEFNHAEQVVMFILVSLKNNKLKKNIGLNYLALKS